jgi:hypothetical protein
MFGLFDKLFRSRRVSPGAVASIRDNAAKTYSLLTSAWPTNERHAVCRGPSGESVAIVENLGQALTLRDTLDLAGGARPSRRLLDAIYLEEFTPAARGDNN